MSVVIAAYNAQATLDECLSHCDRLEYPTLELIVVDDGSTDTTPAIARSHPEVRLLTISHCGLPATRNIGYRYAHGELIVYLDPDAYPPPHWLWYMALAALGTGVGACGGPNVPPPDDPPSARVVARSPGGPVPLLHSPDRAEHVPGCNMAFWRATLDQLNGFDPIVSEAADDVALQLRLRESGHEIAYHPAALVWHRRRSGLRPYLRQQSRNGRGYAMLERRYPDRFPPGQRFRNAARRLRPRVSESDGAASCPVKYLTLARPEAPILELAHQWGCRRP